mmetsp:Transcript_72300/g.159687  ORF Transcript_72300/g.159687 Transcript_72300/m.159687 type:complete len:96 (-) Transcript_72300:10-297(-)
MCGCRNCTPVHGARPQQRPLTNGCERSNGQTLTISTQISPAFQTVPELPVQCDETRFLAVTRELQQSWHSKCSMTMKAVKKVQQWKNNRQNPLRF